MTDHREQLDALAQAAGVDVAEVLTLVANALARGYACSRGDQAALSAALDEDGALVVSRRRGDGTLTHDFFWPEVLPVARREAADPLARAALDALRPKLPADTPPGSVGELFASGTLDGLAVEDGSDRLEIVWTACEPVLRGGREPRTYLGVRARGHVGGVEIEIVGDDTFGATPAPYPAHPEAAERIHAQLSSLLAEARRDLEGVRGDGRGVLRSLVCAALIEASPASFAGWVGSSLAAMVDDVRVGDATISLMGCEIDREPRGFGNLRAIMRLTFWDGEVVFDVREQEVYSGALAPEDFLRAAPDPADPHLAGALALWRGAVTDKLAAAPEPQCLMPHDLLPGELSLPALISTWLEQGPPGPRPESFGSVNKAVQWVEPRLFHALDPAILAAYVCEGWHVLLAPHVPRPHSFEEDRLWLAPPDGDPVLILMSDPWDAPVAMTLDGDAVAFRGFATWLRAAILAAGLDVEWTEDDPDYDEELDADDEDATPTITRSVSDWLRFRDGWREAQGERIWDWRVQSEMVVDGWAFWQSSIYGFTPERARAYEQGIPTWRRFLAEVLDAAG
jgi:hypothetical protein